MRRWMINIMLLGLLSAATCTYNEVVWQEDRPLVWSDFNQGHKNDYFAALTTSGITLSYTAKPTCYNIEVSAVFDKDLSWVNKQLATENLLTHERLHFDITELHTRLLRKRISELPYIDDIGLNNLYTQSINDLKQMQQDYDEETHHSLYTSEQLKWEKEIADQIIGLSAYENPTITKLKPVVAKQ
jgi:hypothetical protein